MMALGSRAMFDGRMSGVHGLTNFSLKQLSAWDGRLNIGQPQIDAQHEAIFALAMKASDAWRKQGDVEQLKLMTAELHESLEEHFSYEEGVLAGFGYADLAEHRAEHQVMLDEMQLIRARVDQMDAGSDNAEPGLLLMNYLLSATVGHILHSDMDYGVLARAAAAGVAAAGAVPALSVLS
ncbi:MAG TPA: hemerythrin family protein [Accumulibacter sp.]|nr:hemerythrin family protein [Accumulibacter sp.]